VWCSRELLNQWNLYSSKIQKVGSTSHKLFKRPGQDMPETKPRNNRKSQIRKSVDFSKCETITGSLSFGVLDLISTFYWFLVLGIWVFVTDLGNHESWVMFKIIAKAQQNWPSPSNLIRVLHSVRDISLFCINPITPQQHGSSPSNLILVVYVLLSVWLKDDSSLSMGCVVAKHGAVFWLSVRTAPLTHGLSKSWTFSCYIRSSDR
jgi:hypothetical protein